MKNKKQVTSTFESRGDEDFMSHPISRMTLKTRDMRPLKLASNNDNLLEQVIRNRQVRRVLGAAARTVLFIECEVDSEPMCLESAGILVAYFSPREDFEKLLVRESELAVFTAKLNHRDNKDEDANANYAYAEECLWMAVCGIDGTALVQHHPEGSDWYHAGHPNDELIATWNTDEPTIGLGLYSDL